MKDRIVENIKDLHGRVAAACELYDRDADDITVVAVTKTRSAAVIKTTVAAGIYNVGESRIQEAEPKLLEVGKIARVHLVGHLQTNKVKKAVQLFDVIQSLDSLKLAEEIDRQAGYIGRTIECLIQVNCSGEEQKFGVEPSELMPLLEALDRLPHIELTGLMTIGPHVDDEDLIRQSFHMGFDLFRAGREMLGENFDCLSMGMSGDFELAIAEGSTMIRVGTALFGPRCAV